MGYPQDQAISVPYVFDYLSIVSRLDIHKVGHLRPESTR